MILSRLLAGLSFASTTAGAVFTPRLFALGCILGVCSVAAALEVTP